MTLSAYIERQKSLIRSRRGISSAAVKESTTYEYDTETLLKELKALKGLNTAERQRYSKCYSCV